MKSSDLPHDPSGAATLPVRHDAIRSAFVAFHKQTSPVGGIRIPAGRFLRGGEWAFIVLALVGFGGGLFLANVSFNTRDEPPAMVQSAPEPIYARSVIGEARAETAVIDTLLAAPPALPTATQIASALSNDAVPVPEHFAPADLSVIAAASIAPTSLPEATANFAAALRLGGIGVTGGSGGGDASQTGFGAIELPSIPEPGTGPMVGLALASLLTIQRWVRQRRESSRS